MTLSNLGVLAARAGDLERGRSHVDEALAVFEQTDDAPGKMGMRLNLGNLAADAGEPERARQLLEASREMADQQRLFRCAGWASLRLAELAIADGDAERTVRLLDAALERLRPLGDRWGVARCLAHMDERLSSGRVRSSLGGGLVAGRGGRGRFPGRARAEGPACSTSLGQAHMRGLVTSRPLFVAGLAS
jgi:tetratricopeptide (TPR) repeat protein